MLAPTVVITPCFSPLFHHHGRLRFNKHMNPWRNSRRWRLGAVENEESQFEINQDKAREALRQLDQQLESLSQQQQQQQQEDSLPRTRPPSSNINPPDVAEPKIDRKFITDMRSEMPEISDSFLAYSAFALVLLTIFNNIIFNVFIKPSVDGYEEVSNIQRTALPDPTELQSPQLADQQ